MDSCDAGSRASTTTMNDEDEDENNAVVVVKKTAAKNEERRRRRRRPFDFSLLLLLPRVVVAIVSRARFVSARAMVFLFVAMDKQLKDVFFEIEKRGKTHNNNITKNTTTKTKLSLSLSLLHVRPVTRVVRGTVTSSSSSSFGKLSIVPVWEG